ncbi:MAG: MarC family protein [Nanoarchaeota archaeon]|nr:MarC family protein [Nanoarchaeota archaeon]MBU1269302.1 MarC family protein [Nanoarchaeota archaeon]MBU1603761.1 MarC family protein [Nanoarchaeota archaeon]MBU2443886.1 MarC family protein [Nanoarchaeota archaeon]
MDFQALIIVMFNLFLIIDPVACIPLLPEMMKNNTKQERKQMIQRAIIIAFVVLIFFTVVGRILLNYFGVGMGAVRIAGGILLFGIGFEMLYGRLTGTESSKSEHKEAIEKKDVSITPLAIPLLAGPGAIATVMMFSSIYQGSQGIFMIITALTIIMLISFLMFKAAETLGARLGGLGIKVIARVMGLLLVFSSTQIFIEGLKIAGIIN